MSRELVQRVQQGDRQAYEELFRLYAPLVTGAVLSRVTRFQDAEDVVQESFLRALQNIQNLRDPEQIGSWLYGMALNVLREHHRTQRAISAEAAPEPTQQPRTGVDKASLRECLEALPTNLREIFVLRHIQGLSYKQLGEMRNATVSSMGERLWKARRMLRQCLLGKEALDPAPFEA